MFGLKLRICRVVKDSICLKTISIRLIKQRAFDWRVLHGHSLLVLAAHEDHDKGAQEGNSNKGNHNNRLLEALGGSEMAIFPDDV